MAEKIPIDLDEPLNPGDIIELHFRTIGMVWIKAAQIALIEWRLKDRKDFTILNHQLVGNNKLIFTIRVEKTNPIILTGLAIAGIIALAGGGIWLTCTGICKIVSAPAKSIEAVTEFIKQPAGAALGIAGAALLGIFAISKLK